MNDAGRTPARLVALFPHDDAAAVALAYRARLFAAGCVGALALPLCVPLGTAASPLRKDALKRLAALVRGFRAGDFFEFGLPRLFAPSGAEEESFTFPFIAAPLAPSPELIEQDAFSPFALTGLLIAAADSPLPQVDSPFPLRFRAGYLSNLLIRPIDAGIGGLSYEWERGESVWMPK